MTQIHKCSFIDGRCTVCKMPDSAPKENHQTYYAATEDIRIATDHIINEMRDINFMLTGIEVTLLFIVTLIICNTL